MTDNDKETLWVTVTECERMEEDTLRGLGRRGASEDATVVTQVGQWRLGIRKAVVTTCCSLLLLGRVFGDEDIG